ncbi:integrase core domain-containing protein [Fodinibius sediminis]|uniref:integrase core domain-containing protein n=1 Tax=Fodinibius sediminis TaxID=1214077 RepID=UPI00115BC260
MIRVDNSPEFVRRKLDLRCNLTLAFIQPGKSLQNGYLERLNGSIYRELLTAYGVSNDPGSSPEGRAGERRLQLATTSQFTRL